ncbi:MAG: hypothetical protein R2780_14755 [Crocinitomicaceae bacterium]
MKTISLVLSSLVLCLPSFAQETSAQDDYFASLFVGTWEHVSSTYPSGNESRYQRDFKFNADGTGLCTRYTKLDTSYQDFEWKVRDSLVFLFLIDEKSGAKLNTDVQFITLMTDDALYLDMKYASPELRKVTYYRRKIIYEVAKY